MCVCVLCFGFTPGLPPDLQECTFHLDIRYQRKEGHDVWMNNIIGREKDDCDKVH